MIPRQPYRPPRCSCRRRPPTQEAPSSTSRTAAAAAVSRRRRGRGSTSMTRPGCESRGRAIRRRRQLPHLSSSRVECRRVLLQEVSSRTRPTAIVVVDDVDEDEKDGAPVMMLRMEMRDRGGPRPCHPSCLSWGAGHWRFCDGVARRGRCCRCASTPRRDVPVPPRPSSSSSSRRWSAVDASETSSREPPRAVRGSPPVSSRDAVNVVVANASWWRPRGSTWPTMTVPATPVLAVVVRCASRRRWSWAACRSMPYYSDFYSATETETRRVHHPPRVVRGEQCREMLEWVLPGRSSGHADSSAAASDLPDPTTMVRRETTSSELVGTCRTGTWRR